jgi:hypothetical protein
MDYAEERADGVRGDALRAADVGLRTARHAMRSFAIRSVALRFQACRTP